MSGPLGHGRSSADATVLTTLAALVALEPWLLRLALLDQLLCAATIAVSVAGFARSTYPVRPVAMVSFGFTFSWLGVGSVYQLAHGVAAWGDSAVTRSAHVPGALTLELLATSAMFAGFYAPGRLRATTQADRAPAALPGRTLPVLYTVACLVLTPGAVVAAGGVSVLFSSRAERGLAFAMQGITLQSAGGIVLALTNILPAAFSVAATYLLVLRLVGQARRDGWRRVSVADVTLFAVAFTLTVLFANPLSHTRAIAAAAFAPLALLCLPAARGRAIGRLMGTAVLAVTLVVYPLANAFRGGTSTRPDGFAVFGSNDFDGFQQVVNSLTYVGDLGHTWGRYTVSALFYFVPRSLWPGKATPASIDVATHRGYYFTNLSLPFHAELYIEFGAVGMVLVLFAIARLGRRLDLAWSTGAQSVTGRLAPYVAVATLMVIRGPLGSLAPVYLTTGALIAAGLWRARSGAGGDGPTVATRPAPSGRSRDAVGSRS